MNKLSETLHNAGETAREGLATARDRAMATSENARRKTNQAIEAGRNKAVKSVESSRAIATRAMQKSGDQIDRNPIAIVLGGLALGAIIGMLTPSSRKEKELMGKTGKRLNEKARKMATAAKEAGKAEGESLGLTSDAVRLQFRDLVAKAADAVRAAGKAAGDAARKED